MDHQKPRENEVVLAKPKKNEMTQLSWKCIWRERHGKKEPSITSSQKWDFYLSKGPSINNKTRFRGSNNSHVRWKHGHFQTKITHHAMSRKFGKNAVSSKGQQQKMHSNDQISKIFIDSTKNVVWHFKKRSIVKYQNPIKTIFGVKIQKNLNKIKASGVRLPWFG